MFHYEVIKKESEEMKNETETDSGGDIELVLISPIQGQAFGEYCVADIDSLINNIAV
ncbi:hypothetical protein OXIME_001592 [Oxyplasma meridianum]|uniref:Uncharacterized protein n=1 Tax=Oxyplasma meridianum TaxID=3073602 RepID=A0AAX4NIX1_9ARCH